MSVSPARSASTRAIGGAVAVAAVVAAGLLVSPEAAFGSFESLAGDPLVFGVVVAGLYLVRPLFAWPTTPLAVVVGYGYGVALGVPVALVGVVASVVPVFLVARRFAATDGARRCETDGDAAGRNPLERLGDGVARYYRTAGPIRGVVASRLVPIPSDVSTCAAAVSGIKLRHFVAGTVVGELPWTVAAVVVGASAATVTAGGLGELGLALGVACGLAAALLLAGPAYRTIRSRRHANEPPRSVDT
ncbi:TVP38/TMEM64 family protein [Natrarchaeobius oligotrophus]|uniref:TVP38/TMEM64 family protein n=1 Tax=Natrarchaeobius chitinivorans TaxID=1679083 RepID=A0A3N6MLQ5_NATCH|nr:VTT domain-containing protein [Natrarchaeobius chitinivorans]RQG96961.1 TVP38/TMEM64 family protein [Natrarchaeobius chitinivorans]